MTGNLRGLILDWDRSSEELEVGGLRLLESEDSVVRQAGFGLLLRAGVAPERLFKLVQKMEAPGESDFLKILRRLDKALVPEEIQSFVADRARRGSGEVRMTAIEALPYLNGRERETVAFLNEMTEGRGATALKFAALESLMRIPVRFRSGAIGGKTLTKLRVTATPDLRFEPAEFTVPAGGAVELEFYNPDNMYHNLVIVEPGRVDEVGMAADLMAARPDGLTENYIPASDGVLFATPQLSMRKRYRLRFFAPDDAGEYEYICTFPGHWRVMRGIMKVVAAPGGDE
jgi:plastocyanin